MRIARKVLNEKSLSYFDLSDEAIASILRYAHVQAALLRNLPDSTQAIYPKNARGLTFYFHVIAGLRRWLLTQPGWSSTVVDGLELVEHQERKVRIGFVTTTETTGVPDCALVSSRPRGPASRAAAARNHQLMLPFPGADSTVHGENEWECWFLCVNRSERVYRVELALPTRLDGGHFSDWAQRILVADVALDSEPILPTEGGGDGGPTKPRFKVRRKLARPPNEI